MGPRISYSWDDLDPIILVYSLLQSVIGFRFWVLPPGGVLPMRWVIHMCRGFDPLFSLWQDRARSFWGIFLIHQQQSYLLGYKNYQFLQKSIFLAPNSIFSSIFLGPIFSGQRHTPISFQAEYPPRVLPWVNVDANGMQLLGQLITSDAYITIDNIRKQGKGSHKPGILWQL